MCSDDRKCPKLLLSRGTSIRLRNLLLKLKSLTTVPRALSNMALVHIGVSFLDYIHYLLLFACLQCFDADGWVAGRASVLLKNWGVGCWHGYLSGVRCRLAYGPADATATHCLLLKNPDCWPFWYRLTWVVPEKGPLNGLDCVRVIYCYLFSYWFWLYCMSVLSQQVGCCHALWMLSETYSVMHYAGVWGCCRPTVAASMKSSMTASMRKLGRTHRPVNLHFWLLQFCRQERLIGCFVTS